MTSLTEFASLGASTAAGNPSSAPTGASQDLVSSQQFLELLVAQIQNQNPLEPLDGTEYVTQLAEFAGLEQLTQVNSGIGSLGQGIGAQITQDMVQMLGTEVTYPGNEVVLDADGVDLTYGLAGPASDLAVTVKDENGIVVGTIESAPREAGINTFRWDGTVNFRGRDLQLRPGNYSFELAATDTGENPVVTQTFSSGRVTGVTYERNQPELMLGEKRIAPGTIIKVVEARGTSQEGI